MVLFDGKFILLGENKELFFIFIREPDQDYCFAEIDSEKLETLKEGHKRIPISLICK